MAHHKVQVSSDVRQHTDTAPQLVATNAEARSNPTTKFKGCAVKLGYTIIYVPNVESSLWFFGHAFGLEQKFLHESGDYGELKTGETTLSFASHTLGEMNFPEGHVRASDSKQPLGMEIGLVTEDVHAAHKSALAHGASEISAPTQKPWGQVVSYVRAPDGTLIELCTPVPP